MAVSRALSKSLKSPQGVCPASDEGAVWWGISDWTLVGLGAVSARLGGRWHLQRRPGNPTCFAPSCAAHSPLARAPSRRVFAWVLWWAGRALWRSAGAWRGGWQPKAPECRHNPTPSSPPCTAHSALACAVLAGSLRGCFWAVGAVLRREGLDVAARSPPGRKV